MVGSKLTIVNLGWNNLTATKTELFCLLISDEEIVYNI
jgi:hypothetical protein